MRPFVRKKLLFQSQLDPDAASYITRASITNAAQIAAINTYVLGLKAAGLWTKITARYITFNSATTAATNLVGNTFTATIVNSPTIDATGYAGGATTYFRTGVIPNTHLSQYNLHIGIFRTGGSSTSTVYQGIDFSTSNRLAIRSTNATTIANFYGNATQNPAGDKRTQYLIACNQGVGATDGKMYGNGSLLNSTSANSGGTYPTSEITFDGNTAGSGVYVSFGGNVNYMLFTIGQSLTSTDVSNDNTLTQDLKTALGL